MPLGTFFDSSPVFYGGRLNHWTIYYRLGRYRPAPDDAKWILLHEEGHLRTLEVWQVYLLALFGLLAWINRTYLPGIFHHNPVYQILTTLAVIMLTFKVCLIALRLDEFRADKWSATVLRDSYSVLQPSKVAHRALSSIMSSATSLDRRREKAAEVYWRAMRILFGDPHPSIEERVRKIAETVDSG